MGPFFLTCWIALGILLLYWGCAYVMCRILQKLCHSNSKFCQLFRRNVCSTCGEDCNNIQKMLTNALFVALMALLAMTIYRWFVH